MPEQVNTKLVRKSKTICNITVLPSSLNLISFLDRLELSKILQNRNKNITRQYTSIVPRPRPEFEYLITATHIGPGKSRIYRHAIEEENAYIYKLVTLGVRTTSVMGKTYHVYSQGETHFSEEIQCNCISRATRSPSYAYRNRAVYTGNDLGMRGPNGAQVVF